MAQIKSLMRRAVFQLRGGERLNGFSDEHSARDFHLLLAAYLCWLALQQFVVVPLLTVHKIVVSGIFVCLAAGAIGPLLLLRRGQKRAAAIVFLGGLWSEMAVYSFFRGGIHSNVGGTMNTVLILAAWLLGRNPTLILVLASVLLGLVESWVEHAGYLPRNYFNGTPFALWFGQTGLTFLAVFPLLSFVDHLRRQVSALRESRGRYRLMAHALESAGECISITDTEDRILYVNDAFVRTYGYGKDELVGRQVDVFRSVRTPVDVQEAILPATVSGNWRGELWNRSQDGREFPISLATSVVYDDEGRRIALVGIAHDISERIKVEEEKAKALAQLQQGQRMESMGRLAGGVAHDFNNLLTVINGYSNLLVKKLPPKSELRSMAGEIGIAGGRAAELTAQLLLLSRKQVLQSTEMNLNDSIAEVSKMLTRVIGDDIRLESVLNPELGCVLADPGQMNQVLMNLAVNARDAMPEGGTLLIETRNVDLEESFVEQYIELKPGAYVELKVTDTGVGMTPETMSHLFEPFFTTKKVGEGTGLGLATVYGIVTQAGGTIWAYSQPGKGTSFKIYLPRIPVVEKIAPHIPDPDLACLRGRETILLVEDQEQLLRIAAIVLRSYGYRVLESSNPVDALQKCESHAGSINLLLTDVVMPHMTGPELASRVKLLRPGIGVLFMSGYSERIADRKDLDGAYLPKPFSPEELVAKVRGVLGSPCAAGAILVVDDDPAIRALLRNLLTEASYHVLEAKDGKDAVRQVETSEIDLVVTDLAMPEQEGFETMKMLRRLRPQLKIIAMSGRFAGPMLRAAEHLGAQASLAKPIQADELLQTISRVMAGETP